MKPVLFTNQSLFLHLVYRRVGARRSCAANDNGLPWAVENLLRAEARLTRTLQQGQP